MITNLLPGTTIKLSAKDNNPFSHCLNSMNRNAVRIQQITVAMIYLEMPSKLHGAL